MIITGRIPAARHVATAAFASGRGGSIIPTRPRNTRPVPVGEHAPVGGVTHQHHAVCVVAARVLAALTLVAGFLLIDLAFFGANTVKLLEGGWVPISIATAVFAIMTTWKKGREILGLILSDKSIPLQDFIDQLVHRKTVRVPGTAVFMTVSRDVAPSVLQHHIRHNRSLQERIILLSIVTEHTPEVAALEKVRVTELSHGFFKVTARYGYIESPDVSEILIFAMGAGLPIEIEKLSFYLGRETILPNGESGMARWRKIGRAHV